LNRGVLVAQAKRTPPDSTTYPTGPFVVAP
jgi:hypothetical protein